MNVSTGNWDMYCNSWFKNTLLHGTMQVPLCISEFGVQNGWLQLAIQFHRQVQWTFDSYIGFYRECLCCLLFTISYIDTDLCNSFAVDLSSNFSFSCLARTRKIYAGYTYVSISLFTKNPLVKVPMKRKLSLSFLKENLKWQSNIFCSFWFPCFVFEIF